MKSTRLKNKAILNIGNKASIIHCINNCAKSQFAKLAILTTSNLKEDDILANLKIKKNFKIFRGSANDVIDRYINCAKKFKVDVIVRVTGDCPFVSNEIIDFLIKKHFENGADYTAARNFSIGTSAEIINTQSLHLIKKMMKNNITEYMTFYFLNNKEFFKINIVDLPKNFVRNYRLTLDYKEDLQMFNELFFYLKKRKLKCNLKNIFQILDDDSRIRKINSSMKLIYKSNKKFVNYLNKKAKFN
jgi:N,N'-diacetyllegionaminate synthase